MKSWIYLIFLMNLKYALSQHRLGGNDPTVPLDIKFIETCKELNGELWDTRGEIDNYHF